jgi:hypothetical protein
MGRVVADDVNDKESGRLDSSAKRQLFLEVINLQWTTQRVYFQLLDTAKRTNSPDCHSSDARRLAGGGVLGNLWGRRLHDSG